ncbi:putative baseplate assembly protein [Streptomyces sp. NPDC005078]|uniref:putative baseplate assembly protein n=1 Tax=unclassified Streptomyces TaxID=2593676 RepID=UPI0033A01D89
MPINVPLIDGRSYQDLLNEAVARIPVHTPEWTNFNRSDPGITLVELFAFMTDSLLYRVNQIPERNRRKFLSLLGVPLQPAVPAQGLVTIDNERAPLDTVTLDAGLEVTAGQVPFRTDLGLDVLPVESRAYYKQPVALTDDMAEVYRRYYASFLLDTVNGTPSADLSPYRTALLDGSLADGVDLVSGTADGSLWIALFARPANQGSMADVRAALAHRTLSLGIVPVVASAGRTLPQTGAGSAGGTESVSHLEFAMPSVPEHGTLPEDPRQRVAQYAVRDARATADVLMRPGVVQVSLPGVAGLGLWSNLEPVESGVDDFPPAIDDPQLAARLVTWLRISARSATQAPLLRVDINATTVTQRARAAGEVLPDGTGQPDQSVRLARSPVIPGSVRLAVTESAADPGTALWQPIDDLLAAGPEVPVPDLRLPPGAAPEPSAPSRVFSLDAEAGVLRFGDGTHGRRPPPDSVLRADYDYSVGGGGNVGPGAINGGPALPAGFTATNRVRTWGGVDAEPVEQGEKQIARYLQHRDRLVTAADFDTVARRTPGVEIGRVEVLSAYDPGLSTDLPGGAPGAVTLLLVPRRDLDQPEAPRPDTFFLDAVCRHLDQRRLVTTELFVRGPDYVPVWVSLGIDVVPGESVAEVRARVNAEMARVLSPLPPEGPTAGPADYAHAATGWPLRTAVTKVELAAFATRVAGVRVVNSVLLAAGTGSDTDRVELTGLQLPKRAGVSVVPGDPLPLDRLRGTVAEPAPGGPRRIPVPVVAEGC